MDTPIKVIWKIKNKHGKINYLLLIFVGILGVKFNKIFKKIKNIDLFDTLIILTQNEIKLLETNYGNYWYRCFHCAEHINNQINKIKNTKSKYNDLIAKFGEEWIKLHIDNYEFINRTTYNYAAVIKKLRENKNIIIRQNEVEDDGIDNNFTSSQSLKLINVDNKDLVGGTKNTLLSNELDISNYINDIDDIYIPNKNIYNNYIGGEISNDNDNDNDNENDNDYYSDHSVNEDIDEQNTEDASDIEDVYDQNNSTNENDENDENVVLYDEDTIDIKDIDENVSDTSKEINKILNTDNERWMYMMADFDDSLHDVIYDIQLKDSYNKVFIYNQYIFMDDTISKIKQKICGGIKQDKIFNKELEYLLPSRIYLWSNYEYEQIENMKKHIKYDKIMLGQKWLKKNDLLLIDIEPNNNIHIYETLKGNLRNLKDSMMKYGSKIKKEINDTYILEEYSDYITNNEIYMVDIYHELGIAYNQNEDYLKNLYIAYVKIYYNLSIDEFRRIIDVLNNKNKNEIILINQEFKTIENDLLMENRITNIFEELTEKSSEYIDIFRDNYITHVVIIVNLQFNDTSNTNKINLNKIVDNFVINEDYPFLQYQQMDGSYIFAFDQNQNIDTQTAIQSKWFETFPFGISFKIKMDQKVGEDVKYISVNLNNSGQINYKAQWKEEDKATIEDVYITYPYIRNLLMKLNIENDKIQFTIPRNEKFKFAFINTIQQINMPNKYNIDHNEFSEFARLAYPYMAIVIEPKKRLSQLKVKNNITSKAGFYGRFKRQSGYEDESKIEQRIITILRNYEYNEKIIIDKITEQFNITDKYALNMLQLIKTKYPQLRKSRKILKSLDRMPKYKPPGIDVNIQGKLIENYKVRISGARSNKQLLIITTFMKKLIYLYIQIYKLRNKNYLSLKDELKNLTNIAKRRHKVEDIVNAVDTPIKLVKQITKLDKERLAYKPGENQNQWTRNCQNSGGKNRRPIGYIESNLDDMIKLGYKFNTKTNEYERIVKTKVGSKTKEVKLKAAQLNTSNGPIYWTCGPEENKEFMYIGFLSKSQNPNSLCAPCCFKKDPSIANNKEKREYHMKCIGKALENTNTNKKLGDKLYILQDSYSTQEGRFSYLPKYLDFYFNTLLNKTMNLKLNYLQSSSTGYFFKYGSVQNNYSYINAIASIFNKSFDELKQSIINALTTKNSNINTQRFTYLNKGDIKTRFGTINNYLNYINTSSTLKHDMVDDILCIPGILYEYGLNTFIFEKRIIIDTNAINENKDKLMDDYVLLCKYTENIEDILDSKRLNIFILKDTNNYFPIIMAIKKESKNIDLIKLFKYENAENNIVKHVYKYFNINCSKIAVEHIKIDNANITYNKLLTMEKHYHPIKQIIDKRNKCIYLITPENIMIPVLPSGIVLNLEITEILQLNTLQYSIKKLMEIINNNTSINIKILGFIYDHSNNNKNEQQHIDASETLDKESLSEVSDVKEEFVQLNKNTLYHIIGIMVDNGINLPIIPIDIIYHELVQITTTNKIKYFYMEKQSLYDKIDIEIAKGKTNQIVDNRILYVNKELYEVESYELFRMEFSNYLQDHPNIKKYIENIINDNKYDKDSKTEKIKKYIYKSSNKEMYDVYLKSLSNINDNTDLTNTISYDGGSLNISINNNIQSTFVVINNDKDDIKNINNYIIKNNRSLCKTNQDKTSCNNNIHCGWENNTCKISLSKEKLAMFINKTIEEMIVNTLKYNEIMQFDNFHVQDIIDPNRYKIIGNRKIIKTINPNMQKILKEIFGADNIPNIGIKRLMRYAKIVSKSVIDNPLEKSEKVYIQIITNNNSIYRAYVNSFYWIKNDLTETTYRNLGYYSILQTDLVNLFKSFIIDYLLNKKRTRKMIEDVKKIIYFTDESVNLYLHHFSKSLVPQYCGIIDLYILNQIHHIPIVIYNIYDLPIVIIDNGFKYIQFNDIVIGSNDIISNYTDNKTYINIKYAISNISLNSIINTVYSVYFI